MQINRMGGSLSGAASTGQAGRAAVGDPFPPGRRQSDHAGDRGPVTGKGILQQHAGRYAGRHGLLHYLRGKRHVCGRRVRPEKRTAFRADAAFQCEPGPTGKIQYADGFHLPQSAQAAAGGGKRGLRWQERRKKRVHHRDDGFPENHRVGQRRQPDEL